MKQDSIFCNYIRIKPVGLWPWSSADIWLWAAHKIQQLIFLCPPVVCCVRQETNLTKPRWQIPGDDSEWDVPVSCRLWYTVSYTLPWLDWWLPYSKQDLDPYWSGGDKSQGSNKSRIWFPNLSLGKTSIFKYLFMNITIWHFHKL